MEHNPTYQGIALDAETALALLEWQVEMGADEPVLDAATDRFELPASTRPDPAPPLQMTAPPAAPPVRRDDGPDLDAMVAQAGALAASAQTLEALAEAQQAYDGIELKKGARNFCFADGNPKARVLILGEAPGDEEDRQGRPFVGRAGQLLDRMFDAIGLSRDAVDAEQALYIVNVLSWRPPGNRDPSPEEIALSMPFVRRHIELAAPDVVVLMGNIPCQAALGRRGILRLRGTWTEAFGRPALPMTHPAYLLRNPPAKREAWADLLSLSARLKG
ncbi:uracil-DNA glycosylase [Paracoccus fistulariae]|uniref:Type-4 uracil-DNA glycosylase n=1 Tax=Paracoccus fistulariae TaxID=658446 RepID=A0ABY7SGG6_9RHOB|nr:uracil-DNA glycosylase [Paracoccus fistulariae]MDB6181661.1 uracil-DNA glycosylase [Paracoccus fistulariae]WCR06033.1 uracil-DNA glycosylase [Paracoccus fistulariae]